LACSYVEILLSQKNIRKEIGREIEREGVGLILHVMESKRFLQIPS
jgi:hypothetical protein